MDIAIFNCVTRFGLRIGFPRLIFPPPVKPKLVRPRTSLEYHVEPPDVMFQERTFVQEFHNGMLPADAVLALEAMANEIKAVYRLDKV
jgi:hypothetical protein